MFTHRLKLKRHWLLPLIAVLAFLLVACGAGTETEPTATPEPMATENEMPVPTDTAVPPTSTSDTDQSEAPAAQAFVDAVNAETVDDQVRVTIIGNLSDACTTITDTEQNFSLDENTFDVILKLDRPEDVACAQVLSAFTHEVVLETADMTPGDYTVTVQDNSDTFTLTAAMQEEEANASVVIAPVSGAPGTELALTAVGLPANTELNVGIGRANSEYDVVDTAVTAVNGTLETRVTVPEASDYDETWVAVIELPDGEEVVSNEFVTTAEAAEFERADIYLVALEDGGTNGEEIGCGDSLVPVETAFEPTVAPLTAALDNMLAGDQQFYGDTDYYNAFYQSDLSVQGIDINNGVATIALTGDLMVGGTCDVPRIEAQLEATALQYSTIDAVNIQINGRPLDEALS